MLLTENRGHNELDEPAFTQPLMYQKIRTRKSVPTLYEEHLVVRIIYHLFAYMFALSYKMLQESEILSPSDPQNFRNAYKSHLDSQLASVQSYRPTADMLGGKWSGLIWPGPPTVPSEVVHNPDTGVELGTLRRIGQHSVEVPKGFVSVFVFFLLDLNVTSITSLIGSSLSFKEACESPTGKPGERFRHRLGNSRSSCMGLFDARRA